MRRLLMLIVFVLTLHSVAAASYSFRDVDTAEQITDALIFLTNGEIITEYIDETGTLLFTSEQNTSYTFLIDSIDTQGFDYAGTLAAQQQINAFPVGSLVGIVKDKNSNVVDHASLQFSCPAYNLKLNYPATTDDYGSFVVEAIPLNTCRIYAAAKGYIGFADVNIEKGAKKEVEIILNQKRAANTTYTVLFNIFILIILTVLVFLGYKLVAETKKKEAEERVEKKTNQPSKKTSNRLDQILPTLNNREAAIVNFLITANNHEANQAVVRHNTSIPRTSLTRTITALQQKNIVEIRSVGKVVKVKLTKWVLEKE